MPIYSFECQNHGEFDVWQKVNDKREAKCPSCGKKGRHILCTCALHGDLPSKPVCLGKTRAELFDNLAKEGMGNKEWRAADEPTNKRFTDAGIKEKPFFGWTPELG